MVSGIFALLLVAGGPNGPEAPQRYQMDVSMRQEVDLSSMGAGSQISEMTGTVYFSVTMSDTTDGRLAHAVIDSMKVSATGGMAMQISQTLADELAGEFVHAYIKDGKVEGTATPSKQGLLMNMTVPIMASLFPGIRGGTETWSDTTSTSTINDDANMNSTSVAAWNVTGMDGDAITATGSASGTVSGEQGGNQIDGQVENSFEVTSVAGGPATSSSMESSQDLIVISPQAPEPLTVIVTSSTKVIAIP